MTLILHKSQAHCSDVMVMVMVYCFIWLWCNGNGLLFHMSCSDEVAVRSFPFICLQRQFAKLASGLFYCWSLLCNNNMAADLQRLTWIYGSRCFAACYCWTQTPLAIWAARQVATRWYSRGRGKMIANYCYLRLRWYRNWDSPFLLL